MLASGGVPEAVVDALRAALPAAEVRPAADPVPLADLAEADAIVAWSLTPEQLAAAPRLRWVQARTAGVEHLPLAELAARGIRLTTFSGVSAPNIAEHVLAMMLAFARRIPTLVRAQERHEWRDTATHREVFELGGQRLLLVGTGAIGREVARRATAFGMDVAGVRRLAGPPPDWLEAVWPVERIDEALATADHVVNSLPNTSATRGLFDAGRFAAMKPGAHFHNVGRGTTVDTAALVEALASGRLAGAGLDVVEPEPLPADSPLWRMGNVLITSHTSGATPRSWERGGPIVLRNARAFDRGEALVNEVDLGAGY